MKIICAYVTDNSDWDHDDPNFAMVTHINYAFARVGDREGTVTESFSKAHKLRQIREIYPGIKISLSVGGWGAGNFSEAAETPQSRRRFAETAYAIMRKYDLDGLDIDWEYPCIPGGGISSHPTDKVNFTLLLQECRRYLNDAESPTGRPYLLTIASGAQKGILDVMETHSIVEYLDLIYLMNYDFGSVASVTGHHGPLYYSQKTPDRWSADQSVQAFLEAHIPPEKIVFGFPFYGRGWTGVENKGDGLNQRVYGDKGLYFDYSKIKTEMLGSGKFKEYWDEQAKAPYMFDGDTFASYENPRSITVKTAYLLQRNLAGGMFWDYSLDHKGELLTALFQAMGNDRQVNR